ncbi:glycosyltransferase [Candidatus Bathyarchaeota archaeon]|nr:glycosyltransferase [Candidatus Bathyarchaeota archaeon]
MTEDNELVSPVLSSAYEPRLSIVLPVYNEASILRQNVESIEKVASQITRDYEIIIAEDGCSDETSRIAADLSVNSSRVIHLHSDRRLGKGLALKRALKACEGRIVTFMDADLSTSLDHLHDVVKLVDNGYDVVIGSRHSRGSCTRRPLFRAIASRTYNVLVRFLFRDSVLDHQCGFKGFNRQVLNDVLDETAENGFLFDTELILRLKLKRLRMIEIPVRWTETGERNSKFRLIPDGAIMVFKLLRLRFRLRDRAWFASRHV